MKMCLWGHGLSDSRLNILMTETSVVGLLQVKAQSHHTNRFNQSSLSSLLFLILWIYIRIDCRWKAEAGDVCVASFEWSCSGICKSVERMKIVHEVCSEGEGAVWNALL